MNNVHNKSVEQNVNLSSCVVENNRGVQHLLDGNVQAALVTFGNVLSKCGRALKDEKHPLYCNAVETEDPTTFRRFSYLWEPKEVLLTTASVAGRSVISDRAEGRHTKTATQEPQGDGFIDWTAFGINSNTRLPFTEASAAFVSNTAIYNLALSHQMRSTQREPCCRAKVEKAIKFYDIAHTLLVRMEQDLDLNCVRFLLAILNNTSRCLILLGKISCAKERCDRVFAILEYMKLHYDGIESGPTTLPNNKVQSELYEKYMINILAWTVKSSHTALAA